MKRSLAPNDVVKVTVKGIRGWTGVLNRIDSMTGQVSVFITQNEGFATWFSPNELKRIGRTKGRAS